VDALVNNAGSSRAETSSRSMTTRRESSTSLMGYVRSMGSDPGHALRIGMHRERARRSGTQPSPNYVLSCFVTAQKLDGLGRDQVAGDGIGSYGPLHRERVMTPIRRMADERRAGRGVRRGVAAEHADRSPGDRRGDGDLITVMASDVAASSPGRAARRRRRSRSRLTRAAISR
jgi:hypothetical protein